MKLHSYELEGRGKVIVALAIMSVCLVWALDAGLDAVDYDPSGVQRALVRRILRGPVLDF